MQYYDGFDLNSFNEPKIEPRLYERVSNYKNIPFCAGVYFVYDEGDLYYVGYSGCLRSRLNNRFIGKLVYIMTFKDKLKARKAERDFIYRFRPASNKRLY